MYTQELNISVAIISHDPYFLFAARALLGRDRHIRVRQTESTFLEYLEQPQKVDVIICDLDLELNIQPLYSQIEHISKELPNAKILCLVDAGLDRIPITAEKLPFNALVAKNDLGYCLHLATVAVTKTNKLILTPKTESYFREKEFSFPAYCLIEPEVEHFELKGRVAQCIIERVVIGLDIHDIADELGLKENTVKTNIYRGYSILLEATTRTSQKIELQAFYALSQWWWDTRFKNIE